MDSYNIVFYGIMYCLFIVGAIAAIGFWLLPFCVEYYQKHFLHGCQPAPTPAPTPEPLPAMVGLAQQLEQDLYNPDKPAGVIKNNDTQHTFDYTKPQQGWDWFITPEYKRHIILHDNGADIYIGQKLVQSYGASKEQKVFIKQAFDKLINKKNKKVKKTLRSKKKKAKVKK